MARTVLSLSLPVLAGTQQQASLMGTPSGQDWTGQDSLPEGHCYLQQRLLMALGTGSTVSEFVLPTACQEARGESSRLRFTIPGGRLQTGPLGLRGGFGVAGT